MGCGASKGGTASNVTESRYQRVRLLGTGASCEVIEAEDRVTKKHVAIKILQASEKYNKVRAFCFRDHDGQQRSPTPRQRRPCTSKR
jgi:serine/threonine protein kinase